VTSSANMIRLDGPCQNALSCLTLTTWAVNSLVRKESLSIFLDRGVIENGQYSSNTIHLRQPTIL